MKIETIENYLNPSIMDVFCLGHLFFIARDNIIP